MKSLEPVTPNVKTLAEEVRAALEKAILDGRLRPGQRLLEGKMAEALDVSRVPVREALSLLRQIGLVRGRPHRGNFVADLSPEFAVDVFGVRGALEGLASRLATEKLTEQDLQELERLVDKIRDAANARKLTLAWEYDIEFHKLIWRRSNRPFLIKLLESIEPTIKVCLYISKIFDALDLETTVAKHEAIMEALRSRDPDLVERVMREHIAFGQRVIRDRYSVVDRAREVGEVAETRSAKR